MEYRWSVVVLRPYGGDRGLYIGFGWPGLKKMGVEISEVLNLMLSSLFYSVDKKERLLALPHLRTAHEAFA